MTVGEFTDRVVVVTGGASGLGRAMVEGFAGAGAHVVVADRDEDGARALVEALGPSVAFVRTDVAEADDVQRAVDTAVERFGGLHVMCNNAGIGGSPRSFLDDDLTDFDRVLRVNLYGVMVGIQRAARHMATGGGGAIVNTTSIGGMNAGGGVMAYRASKAAVIHVTRCLAVELAGAGIRVNAVAPAHIPTPINAAFDQSKLVAAMQPLQRVGTPDDVAQAVMFLASDRAAQITGVVLPVDGGTTAGPRPRPLKDLLAGGER